MFRSFAGSLALAALVSACSSSGDSKSACTDANTNGIYAVKFVKSDSARTDCPDLPDQEWKVALPEKGSTSPDLPADATPTPGEGLFGCEESWLWTKPVASAPASCGAMQDESGTVLVHFNIGDGTLSGTYAIDACPETIGGTSGRFCSGMVYDVTGVVEHPVIAH